LELQVCDDDGNPLDAKIEIFDNSFVLQSRGGTKGTSRAQNIDYSVALRLLLSRIHRNRENFLEAYVDSNRVQNIARRDRQVLSPLDLTKPTDELFTLISRRMQAVGKSEPHQRPTGNANKRIRFAFANLDTEKLVGIANGTLLDKDTLDPTLLSSEDRFWTEGNPVLETHLRKERASGLSNAKKAEFIREHGRLFCEECQFDPVAFYDDTGATACIEVHHRTVAVSEMALGHKTKLADLQCLCANCHRVTHVRLKIAALEKAGSA
jgi:hypothetical protein